MDTDRIHASAEQHRSVNRKSRSKRVTVPTREEKAFDRYYRLLRQGDSPSDDVDTMTEWMLDNYSIIKERVRSIRTSMGRIKNIPILDQTELCGYPRIYAVCHGLVDATHGVLTEDAIVDHLRKYQDVTVLDIDELWLMNEFISVCLLQNIFALISRRYTLSERQTGMSRLAAELCHGASLADCVSISDTLTLARLIRCVQDRPDCGKTLERMDRELKNHGLSFDQVLGYAERMELNSAMTFANLVTGLINVGTLDWQGIFDAVCIHVEALREGDDGTFAAMDDESRQLYLKRIVKEADKRGITQLSLVEELIADAPDGNIGEVLFVDDGRGRKLLYFTALYAVWAIIMAIGIGFAGGGVLFGIAFGVLFAIPAKALAARLVGEVFLRFTKPTEYCRLDQSQGLTGDTVLLVPALITDKDSVTALAERMETNYIANRDKRLKVVLLGDLTEADSECTIEDERIKSFAKSAVADLNEKYGKGIFFFICRPRVYSATQGKYFGWERKRGAVIEFNRFITGRQGYHFSCVSEGAQCLVGTKYVVTLDADTLVPHGGVARLVGIMEHPLNKPLVDDNGMVTKGYGILQPRMETLLTSADKTSFARLTSGDVGSCPYCFGVSELYQDVLGEGSFAGKGIYCAEIFARAIDGRFPENSILSHDMIEGVYLKAGYVSDVVLLDETPSGYISFRKRAHRWMRGDWQLLPYLKSLVKNSNGQSIANTAGMVARYKIWQSMSNALPELAVCLLLLLGAVNSRAAILGATVIILREVIPLVPILCTRIWAHCKGLVFTGGKTWNLTRTFIHLLLVGDTAANNLDAAVRSVVRLRSGKRLLEWQTAMQAESSAKNGARYYYSVMRMSVILGVVLAALGAVTSPVMLVFGVLFMVAPWVMYRMSGPKASDEVVLDGDREDVVRLAAKGAWAYFRDNCKRENSYLPPDNLQVMPYKGDAKRTSPTNMGMMLAGVLAAEKLGYIKRYNAVEMIQKTVSMMLLLEKWNGHPYNWYDIQTLEPLEPKFVSSADNGNLACSLLTVREGLTKYLLETEPNGEFAAMVQKCRGDVVKLLDGLDMGLLYDEKRGLLSVGYDVSSGKLSPYCYDMLASESRQASFYGIVSGKLPQKHWRRLARPCVVKDGEFLLKSWGGTMFEYLMPSLFMKTYERTLSDFAGKGILYAQKIYSASKGTPWGVSESGYLCFDEEKNYQYKAFGIPMAAVRRIRSDSHVITPYATALALAVDKKDAADNLLKLKENRLYGEYGFYEAWDLSSGEADIVYSFMAHHQGMILLSAVNALEGGYITDLFHSAPEVRSGEYLLMERMPSYTPRYRPQNDDVMPQTLQPREAVSQAFDSVGEKPYMTVLSNGEYTTGISTAGSNYSAFGGIMTYKWQADAVGERQGHFIFVKETASGETFSATPAPLYNNGVEWSVRMQPDKVSFVGKSKELTTCLNVAVAADHRATVFELKVENTSDKGKRIFVSDYAAASLESMEEGLAHPQYSQMFCRVEKNDGLNSVFVTRRPRHDKGKTHYMGITLSAPVDSKISFVTDKQSFIGRCRDIGAPLFAQAGKEDLNGDETGIAKCVSVGTEVMLPCHTSAELVYTVFYAESYEDLEQTAAYFVRRDNCKDVFSKAHEHSVYNINRRHISQKEYRLINSVISSLYYPFAYGQGRAKAPVSHLWQYGISGDLPIICCGGDCSIAGLRLMLKVYEYLTASGVKCDLVIITNDDGYHKNNYDAVKAIVQASRYRGSLGKKGGIFIVRKEKSGQSTDILESFASVMAKGSTARIFSELVYNHRPCRRDGIRAIAAQTSLPKAEKAEGLLCFNGYGGFDKDGYKIILNEGQTTPHPWSNVIANQGFGTVVTERGGGFVWCGNSRENKLTTWSNDPISDPPSEAVYVKSNTTNRLATAERLDGKGACTVIHGRGWSQFTHRENDFDVTRTVFVPRKDNIKLSLVNITNTSEKATAFTVFYYADVRMSSGVAPREESLWIRWDKRCDVLTCENLLMPQNQKTFMLASHGIKGVLCDKVKFIGRMGNICHPAATDYSSWGISPVSSAGNCMVIRTEVEVKPHCTARLVLGLGCGNDDDIREYKIKYSSAKKVLKALEEVRTALDDALGRVKIVTADSNLDLMFNTFLLYQSFVCRYYAKTSFYQCSGAYGFRDQLQDALAFMYCDADEARRHILRAAAQQFEQGDVRHWWHEQTGYGVRTKISDDLLFLPFVCGEYVRFTGDKSIYDQQVPFAIGQEIKDGETSHFGKAYQTEHTADVYRHCVKAITKAAEFGRYSLPLIGTGDWNDGFDKVGENGQGQSVWLAFFMHYTIRKFRSVCEERGDDVTVKFIDDVIKTIENGIQAHGWDGKWYRRAYYDDGEPLGSDLCDECKIDVIAQAWAAIADITPRKDVEQALCSVEEHLVDEELGIVKLFTPPFENSDHDPGYIKAYRSGLRENGGQYTHGAIWLVWAYMKLGMSDKAYRILKMLNPVEHSLDVKSAQRYKVEPYVVAADVYSAEGARGMGGWTWYTGSAAWMYRVILEQVLGFTVAGDKLTLSANVATALMPLRIEYRHGNGQEQATYTVDVLPFDKTQCELDGEPADYRNIPLCRDGKKHKVVLRIERH